MNAQDGQRRRQSGMRAARIPDDRAPSRRRSIQHHRSARAIIRRFRSTSLRVSGVSPGAQWPSSVSLSAGYRYLVWIFAASTLWSCSSGSEDPSAIRSLALEQYRREECQSAVTTLTRLLQLDEQDLEARRLRGNCYAKLGSLSLAISDMKAVVRYDSRLQTLLTLADLQFRTGHYSEAFAALREASASPRPASEYLRLEAMQRQYGDFVGARETLSQVSTEYRNWRWHSEWGSVLARLGEPPDQYEDAFDIALRMEGLTRENRGLVLIERADARWLDGRYVAALRDYQWVLTAVPQIADARVYTQAADSSVRTGDLRRGAAYYQSALQLDIPDDMRWSIMLNLARVLVRSDDRSRARNVLQALLADSTIPDEIGRQARALLASL